MIILMLIFGKLGFEGRRESLTRLEFIQELDGLLRSLSDKERLDILADYTKHFLSGMEQGKSEEEIAASLGSPEMIAQHIIEARGQERQVAGESVPIGVRSIIVAIALIMFNLIFVLGPFIGLLGTLFGMFAVAVALVLSPLGIVSGMGYAGTEAERWFIVFAGIAAVGLGGMIGVALIAFTKWIFYLTKRYLQFNLTLIRGK
ncbi:UNVERIFIED_CONTAM: putative membrane protein [Brevibacillus sp. OAP136]